MVVQYNNLGIFIDSPLTTIIFHNQFINKLFSTKNGFHFPGAATLMETSPFLCGML